ncbi:MAG TPA: M14 family zinc carboxypeptidase [Pirellulales bacterium]|nr:M14 family zinc carboxypeptidase [Pirellulales bacterium]
MNLVLRRGAVCVWAIAACCGSPLLAAFPSAPVARPSTRPSGSVQALASAATSREGNDTSSRDSRWDVLGRTIEDRVIEYRQFGEGRRQVLVVGPLDGDEVAGLELVEQLAEHLDRFPRRTNGARVTLVRDPNPDGRLRRLGGNARGVRLDRNFPTRNWRKIPMGSIWLSGREPESEPETRVVIDLLGDVRPDQVIVLGATRRNAELTYTGPAEGLAREFAKLSGLRPMAANTIAEQGSLAVYIGTDRDVPTLQVRVPAGMRRDVLWSTYKRALLAVLGGESAEGDDPRDDRPAVGEPSSSTGSPGVAQAIPQRDLGDKVVSPERAQPFTVLATAKGGASGRTGDATGGQQPAGTPSVLSADDLEFGGELVPVTPVPREHGLAPTKPQVRPPANKRTFAAPRATVRAQPNGNFPPATLVRPNANSVVPSAPTQSPSGSQKTVERLPAVDTAPAALPRRMPQPIPLYPETGY